MEILGIPPGRDVGRAWAFLKELRLERGAIGPEAARAALLDWWEREGGGFSVASAASVAMAVGRANGEAPSTAAYSVAPRDQRSAAGPAVPSRARSGAI